MLRFNRLVCVVAVCLVVGVAFGAAIKIRAITPYEGTEEALAGGDGMAILNYHPGNNKTEATVAITDFVPGATYGAYLNPGGGVNLPEVANPSGNANWHGTYNFDLCLWNEDGITVYIWRDANGNLLPDLPDEVVAEGFAPCP